MDCQISFRDETKASTEHKSKVLQCKNVNMYVLMRHTFVIFRSRVVTVLPMCAYSAGFQGEHERWHFSGRKAASQEKTWHDLQRDEVAVANPDGLESKGGACRGLRVFFSGLRVTFQVIFSFFHPT